LRPSVRETVGTFEQTIRRHEERPMKTYYRSVSTPSRRVPRFAGELDLNVADRGMRTEAVTRPLQRDPTPGFMAGQRQLVKGLVVRVIAAGAFVAVLFALIVGVIELALVL
jgi:hypothetical protein